MLPFTVAVSQQLFGCIGLFIRINWKYAITTFLILRYGITIHEIGYMPLQFNQMPKLNGKFPIRRFLIADLQSLKIVMAYLQLTLPSLTHLTWLDCVEVQRSARHLEDHIQSIQVLHFSSMDLHMLSVCA
jgi:hypothetical protein